MTDPWKLLQDAVHAWGCEFEYTREDPGGNVTDVWWMHVTCEGDLLRLELEHSEPPFKINDAEAASLLETLLRWRAHENFGGPKLEPEKAWRDATFAWGCRSITNITLGPKAVYEEMVGPSGTKFKTTFDAVAVRELSEKMGTDADLELAQVILSETFWQILGKPVPVGTTRC